MERLSKTSRFLGGPSSATECVESIDRYAKTAAIMFLWSRHQEAVGQHAKANSMDMTGLWDFWTSVVWAKQLRESQQSVGYTTKSIQAQTEAGSGPVENGTTCPGSACTSAQVGDAQA